MRGTPNPTSSAPAAGPVAQAKADLARRLSINADQIEVLRFEAVTWPDGSLGCPQPGMQYSQVLVEGYLVQLRAAGQDYEYHGAGTQPPILCQGRN